MTDKKQSGGVHIGSVTGGIHGSIIAGRDVKNATITLGGQATSAEEQPTVEKLAQLLAEIQQELATVIAEKEALETISADAPFTAQGAQANVKAAAEKVQAGVPEEEAASVEHNLEKATTLIGGILDGAKMVIEKGGELAEAAKPVAEKLAPLADKAAVAALWAYRLWPEA